MFIMKKTLKKFVLGDNNLTPSDILGKGQQKFIIGGYFDPTTDCGPFWVHPNCSKLTWCHIYNEDMDYLHREYCDSTSNSWCQSKCDGRYSAFQWSCDCSGHLLV